MYQFPDTSINDLTNIIQRYKDIDAWYNSTYINKKDFMHIGEILDNNELKINYNNLVNNDFSK